METVMSVLDRIIVDNRIVVLIDSATGEVVAVQDVISGCAAEFLFSKGEIARATLAARNAWQSTADCFA